MFVRAIRGGALLSLLAVVGLFTICQKSTPAYAAGETFSGGSSFSGSRDDRIPLSGIQVTGTGNDTVGVNIFVSAGDLRLSTITGLTFTSSTAGNDLQFSGTRSDVNAALATLTFKPEQTTDYTVQFTINGLINSIYDPVSHHVYQDVPNVWYNWNNAKIAAESAVFQDNSGYLATITSETEQSIVQRLGRPGWLGGSDTANEGVWNWVGGPETGQNFWNGGPDGTVADGMFAHWSGDMPDNYTGSNPAGENCVEMRDRSSSYNWNDQNCEGGVVSDYIVEYGDDINNPVVTYKDVSVHVTPGQDLNNDGQEDAGQPQIVNFLTRQNKWISVDLGFNCEVLSSSYSTEDDLATADQDYDYLGGLVTFSGQCQWPRSTTTLHIYYYDETAADVLLRKYDPNTQAYTTLSDIDVQDQTIDGHNVAVATYTIYDGSDLDTDGNPSNNQFTDPIGLATTPATTPITAPSTQSTDLAGTGQNQLPIYIFATFLTIPILGRIIRLRTSR